MHLYTVQRSIHPPFIEVVMQGAFDAQTCLVVATEARQAAAKHACNVLYDVREAALQLSVADQYDWPRRIAAQQVGTPKKLAILSNEHTPCVDFMETAAQNAAQNIRVFTDRDRAVAWVASDEP